MPNINRVNPPTLLWDEENECWIIQHGGVLIQFLEPGDLIVAGSNVTAQVTYDRITEERGLRFQDKKARTYEDEM